MKLSIKVALQATRKIEADEVVRMFSRWIEDGVLADKKPIEVIDYSHVPFGPGVMLVMEQSEFTFYPGDKCALTYSARREGSPDLAKEMPCAVGALLTGAHLVEGSPEMQDVVALRLDRFDVSVVDGGSTALARAMLEPNRRAVEACFSDLFDREVEIVDLALSGAYRAMVRARRDLTAYVSRPS